HTRSKRDWSSDVCSSDLAGIFINVVFYLPMTLFLFYTPYTGHARAHAARTKVTLLDSFRVLGTVRHHKSILTVLVLAALASTTEIGRASCRGRVQSPALT